MAVTTYAELQTAVANQVDHSGLTARIPEFIARAEAKINRTLRVRQARASSYASYLASTTTRRLAFPTNPDMQEFIGMMVREESEDDEDYTEMVFVNAEQLQELFDTEKNRPQFFTIHNEFEFERLPDVDYRILAHFYKPWDIATDSTNWLLTNHHDIYLHASVAQAKEYMEHFDAADRYWGYASAHIEELNKLDRKTRNDPKMRMRELQLLNRQRYAFDVNRGY